MWPFGKRENRADYTQAVVDRIVATATGGNGEANVGATAAATAAGGIFARSFASATIAPSVERTGLTATVLADMGGAFVFAGESVWLIEVTGSRVCATSGEFMGHNRRRAA